MAAAADAKLAAKQAKKAKQAAEAAARKERLASKKGGKGEGPVSPKREGEINLGALTTALTTSECSTTSGSEGDREPTGSAATEPA